MRDTDWIFPSFMLTAVSALCAISLIPDYSGILPAIAIVPLWMMVASLLTAVYALVVMARAGVVSPLAHIGRFFVEERRTAAVFAFGIFLAGLNMTTFMWTKPLLNYLIPFWADPLLADLDKALFFGRDPWIFLSGLNTQAMAIFYHRGWIAIMIMVLILVLSAPPSPRKSATMLSYFLLWSVAGPLIHILLPAAGPIFYEQMGYGDRFAALQHVSATNDVATYLWTVYAGQGFGPGSGISAMPSLHIATTAWMLIAVHIFARPMFLITLAAGCLIFLLSVALGWHYAMDGIVGGAAAYGCYRGGLLWFARRTARRAIVLPA